MGIKYSNVVLECEFGGETLTVRPSTEGEVVFELWHRDGQQTFVYVTEKEARQFADSIISVAEIAERK